MAAAHVKWSDPAELLPQLTRRLADLQHRARGLEGRHQTLRAAMDWSYGLLDAGEQAVLRHLGVFRGSFSGAALDAVCDAPVAARLQSLMEKSLVQRQTDADGAPRLSVLEMIREYALERLAAERQVETARAR